MTGKNSSDGARAGGRMECRSRKLGVLIGLMLVMPASTASMAATTPGAGAVNGPAATQSPLTTAAASVSPTTGVLEIQPRFATYSAVVPALSPITIPGVTVPPPPPAPILPPNQPTALNCDVPSDEVAGAGCYADNVAQDAQDDLETVEANEYQYYNYAVRLQSTCEFNECPFEQYIDTLVGLEYDAQGLVGSYENQEAGTFNSAKATFDEQIQQADEQFASLEDEINALPSQAEQEFQQLEDDAAAEIAYAEGLEATLAQSVSSCAGGQFQSPNLGVGDSAGGRTCDAVATAVEALEYADPSSLVSTDPPVAGNGPLADSEAEVNSGDLGSTGVGFSVDGQPVNISGPSAADGIANANAPYQTAGGGVVYANAARVTTFADVLKGESLSLTLQQLSPSAPSVYRLPISSSANVHLIPASKGTVTLFNSSGRLLGTFSVPTVKTASGGFARAALTTSDGAIVLRVTKPSSQSAYPLEISTLLTPAPRPKKIITGGPGEGKLPKCDGDLTSYGDYHYFSIAYLYATKGIVSWQVMWSASAVAVVDGDLTASGTEYIDGRRITQTYPTRDEYPRYLFHQDFEQFTYAGESLNHSTFPSGKSVSIRLYFEGPAQKDGDESYFEGNINLTCTIM